MAGITLDGVSKRFAGGVQAVDDVSLEIGDGEFMVLVGPSGCGKSTLLRMVAGLEEVTDGEIAIGDRVVTDLPPKDRDIAMVFQNYALYPHMTVEQNLGFGLKLRKTPKAEIKRRVDDVARILGLEPLLKRKPAALSGGQRQRVAMGRAMVREPQRLPDGRAALEPRRQAARADARRARPPARPAQDDDRLRDARSGRGDDARRSRRRHARRRPAAGATRRRTSSSTRPTCSWPRSSARPSMNLVEAEVGDGKRRVRGLRPAGARRVEGLGGLRGPHA